MANKPLSVDQALTRAESLGQKGELDQARHLYRAVLEKLPENKRAKAGLNALATPSRDQGPAEIRARYTQEQIDGLIALYDQGQLQEALEQGTALAEQHPGIPLIHYILGGVNTGLARIDEAAASYTKAQQNMPDNAEAHFNLGNALHRIGRSEAAVTSYSEAVQIDPDYAEAHNNLGIALKTQGELDQAIAHYTKALQIKPDFAKAHNNLGNVLAQVGKSTQAIDSYTKAIQIEPDYAEAHYNLGNALKSLGKYDDAIASYTRAVQIAPDYADAHNNMGSALTDVGNPEAAIDSYTKALQIKPDNAKALNNLGNALKALGKHDEAIANYTKALQITPDYTEAHYNLGNALKALGKHDDAIASYTKALQIEPNYADAHNNLGTTLVEIGESAEAIAYFTNALKIQPENAKAHNNLGNALKALGKIDQAITNYTKALRIQPDYTEAHYNLGNAFMGLSKHEDAIASYTRALQIAPDYAEAKVQKIHQQAHICDWVGLAHEGAAIAELGIAETGVPPLSLLSFEDHPQHHRQRAETFAAKKYSLPVLADFERPRVRPERIRIGYFSADFHNHATMHLMVRLFELHDEAQFALHAYSYGPDNNDDMRYRLTEAVEVFHDVRGLGDKEVAQLARDEKIDIAIDLKGYTKDSRSGIFAYRAAPIQLNYLGYPGTMGAPFIDYIVADQTLIPPDAQQFYAEKVVYLPHSYQANDNTRRIAERTPSREEAGLPETGFVFCCFNNTYKISPAEFDIWMRLLHKIDGSVLWLLKTNPSAEKNLLQEAQSRGIARDRLVFAERLPSFEHLARHRLADLFLDTFNYNAHTTASDALWAGLPVLTKLGEGFAARVAGSLLNAIDLPELITANEQAYENLALELATHPEQLQAIKDKLRTNRDTKPLFDTELFTEHLEEAYRRVYDRYFDGDTPAHIDIHDGAN